jgi:hypothetical protein
MNNSPIWGFYTQNPVDQSSFLKQAKDHKDWHRFNCNQCRAHVNSLQTTNINENKLNPVPSKIKKGIKPVANKALIIGFKPARDDSLTHFLITPLTHISQHLC